MVPIKLQLGEKTLFAPELRLQVREIGLDDETPPVAVPMPPVPPVTNATLELMACSLAGSCPGPDRF